jgi:hypothetical protein
LKFGELRGEGGGKGGGEVEEGARVGTWSGEIERRRRRQRWKLGPQRQRGEGGDKGGRRDEEAKEGETWAGEAKKGARGPKKWRAKEGREGQRTKLTLSGTTEGPRAHQRTQLFPGSRLGEPRPRGRRGPRGREPLPPSPEKADDHRKALPGARRDRREGVRL